MGTAIGLNPSTRYAVSEGEKFAADSTLVVVQCFSCGVTYAIPESFDRSARKYHGDRPNGWKIVCPFGHTWFYVGETKEEKLKRQIQATKDLLAQEERAHQATVADAKRQKKRASAGVCPCCNRTFQQLARHMASKHPDYGNGHGGDFKDLPKSGLLVTGWSSKVVHLAVFGAKSGKRAASMCGLVNGWAYSRDALPEHDKDLPLCSKCAPYA
jgi:hypothetical protein